MRRRSPLRPSGLWLMLPLLLLPGCTPRVFRETREAMSTFLTVSIVSRRMPDWDALFERAQAFSLLYDHRREGSPVHELNATGEASLPPAVLGTLEVAVEVAQGSGGAFDPTILPLTSLWSFDTGGVLPPPDAVQTARAMVGFTRLRLGGTAEAALPRGMGLDLGGIAKGAVVDELAAYLESLGYGAYLINAGGDVLGRGRKPGDRPWVVGVQHPRSPESLAGLFELPQPQGPEQQVAVVTSGDYELFFEREGTRYHHILDPRTGYPARGCVSVTVIAPTCALADALATAAFVLGVRRGAEYLEGLPGVEALLIGQNGGSLVAECTSGFPLRLPELEL